MKFKLRLHAQSLVLAATALMLAACSSEQKTADPNAHSEAKATADLGMANNATPTPSPTPVPLTDAEKAQQEVVLPKTLQAAVNSSYRTVENTKRDQYRHPLETLKFFGVQPQMTIVEITPGAGWYTEILAPFLASKGQYIGAFPTAGENAEHNETTAKVIAWLKSHHEFDGHVTLADFHPPDSLNLAPEGSADMVLTFRNVHNWLEAGTADSVFAAFYKALKPGGILGIEDHRANPKLAHDPKAMNGYVLEKDMIALANKAGFKLVAKSEVNANKKDTKDYEDGVWTLPPTLRLKDKERAKYVAIGESDRMTLKFMKPKK